MEAAPHYTLLTLLTVSKVLYTVDADDMVHTVDMVYTVESMFTFCNIVVLLVFVNLNILHCSLRSQVMSSMLIHSMYHLHRQLSTSMCKIWVDRCPRGFDWGMSFFPGECSNQFFSFIHGPCIQFGQLYVGFTDSSKVRVNISKYSRAYKFDNNISWPAPKIPPSQVQVQVLESKGKMYLCQHSQRHSRVQHCKDQGEDISNQPLQSLSPLHLGGHRVSAWLHLLSNTTTALQLLTLFVEHSHFFAPLCTSLHFFAC